MVIERLFHFNWGENFALTVSLTEIFLRGTIVYLVIFMLLRVVFKREMATLGVADLLVIVLLGDAAQNAMANDCKTITDGLLLVATLIFWAYALDWLAHRFPAARKVLRPSPLQLVQNGQMLRRHMRQELITEEELMSQLRQQGVEDLSQVKSAYMEGDGQISVIQKDAQNPQKPERPIA